MNFEQLFNKLKVLELTETISNDDRVKDAIRLSNLLRMDPQLWKREDPAAAMGELVRGFHLNTMFSRLFNHWSSRFVSKFLPATGDDEPDLNKYRDPEGKGGTDAFNALYLLWKDEIENAIASIPYVQDVRDADTGKMVDPAGPVRKYLSNGREGDFVQSIRNAMKIETEAFNKLSPGQKRDYANLMEIYNEEYVQDIDATDLIDELGNPGGANT